MNIAVKLSADTVALAPGEAARMNWAIASSAYGPVGRPTGDIDDAACPGFLANLLMGLGDAEDAKGNFVLDLAEVDHIAANALLTLTMARKDAVARGVKIILARPTQAVREILEISRYQLIFDIVDSLEPGAN
jgi:anti-anti-sigma factor